MAACMLWLLSDPCCHSVCPLPQALKLANEMFARWNATLQTGNASAVAKLYKEDGVLLPTVSNNVSQGGGQ